MPRRKTAVAGPTETFDLRLVARRHLFGRRTAQSAVEQTRLAGLLMATTSAAEGPLADAEHRLPRPTCRKSLHVERWRLIGGLGRGPVVN
jgi:hypothetical protein